MTPTVLILFLSGAVADAPMASALIQALHQALGPHLQVTVREQPSATEDLVDRERQASGATGAARVECLDPGCLTAFIYVSLAGEAHGKEQLVRFIRSDPLDQRGRALGAVIAHHMIELSRPALAASEPVVKRPEGPPEPTPTTRDPDPRWSAEAFVTASVPFAGPGRGFGGGLAVRWRPLAPMALRLGLRLRSGEIGAAQATYSSWALSAGVHRRLTEPGRGTWPAIALRAESLLLQEAFTHFSSDDPSPVRRRRLLAGAAALLELQWRLGRSAALLLAVGAEAAAGATEVLVRYAKVAEVSPWRAVGEAGLRTSF